MYEKYLIGGSLNPYWVNELQEKQLDETLTGLFDSQSNLITSCLKLQLAQIEFERVQREIEFRNKLEIAYDFFKTHSNSHEKKELCKYVIGATCRL